MSLLLEALGCSWNDALALACNRKLSVKARERAFVRQLMARLYTPEIEAMLRDLRTVPSPPVEFTDFVSLFGSSLILDDVPNWTHVICNRSALWCTNKDIARELVVWGFDWRWYRGHFRFKNSLIIHFSRRHENSARQSDEVCVYSLTSEAFRVLDEHDAPLYLLNLLWGIYEDGTYNELLEEAVQALYLCAINVRMEVTIALKALFRAIHAAFDDQLIPLELH